MELTDKSTTAEFDPADYRRTLGLFPTGVVIVTGHDTVGPAGLVIGSFTSVSLDPALVGFFPAKSSSSWPRIAPTSSFCVNVLAADQLALCESFASRGGDKFGSVPWRAAAATGSPVLDGVIAWIDGRVERIDAAGDHWFVLGRVEQIGIGRDDVGPLLFCQRVYGTFAPDAVDRR